MFYNLRVLKKSITKKDSANLRQKNGLQTSSKEKELERILLKINKKEKLTGEEDIFYFMTVIGMTRSDALTALCIVNNKNPNLLID